MVLHDKIFGKTEINSLVLIELINSKPLQRLKKISLYGPPKKYYHLKDCPSRFEHSLQVFLILKQLGAGIEEQIAGLTHDISHTAFSHVVDWIFGLGQTEEFQDNQHEKFFENSEVSEILKKYNYDPKRIANFKNFPLLDQEIPVLCADRIGYSIREFPKKIIKQCLDNLTVFNNKIVFKNKKSAKIFALNFLKRQKIHWGSKEAVARYALLAKILKIALDQKIIDFDDLWKDDNYMIKKLEKSKNKKIQKYLSILQKKSLKNLPKSETILHKKFRHVDPEFIKNKTIVKLSTVDLQFRKLLIKERQDNLSGINIPLF